MESQKPKIALYVKRPFGEKLNVSFDFIKENWKSLLKFSTYLLLPLSLIQALSLNGLMGGAMNLSQMAANKVGMESEILTGSVSFFMYYGIYILLFFIGSVTLTSLVYALIETYNKREERLLNITLKDIKSLLIHNVKRLLVLMLVCVAFILLVIFLMGFLGGMSPYTMILTIPAFIVFVVPLALLAPIYLFEGVSIVAAFKKTFRLGFATWGGVFLMMIVMGIIASVLQGVTMMPWYIATIVKYFFAVSDTGNTTTVSAGYSFLLYLLGIIQVFGVYLSMIFSLVGMTYQYGHATEVVDSITVENDIDNFDKL